ncbi:HSP20-like chaperone [Boletus reticuloceps]|uniref:HSP20-like chaperone n=1 Tax=Boletus reticuloceps TaxID=495285 RepID=A0A8I2YEK0_9AGAM|nr:HSP20-like chaperone [Boletus reticuloceps]
MNSRKRPRKATPSWARYSAGIFSDDDESLAVSEAIPTYSPRMNMYENTESNMVTITFELPGLKRDHVAIHLLHNELTIWGELMDQSPQGEGKYSHREIPHGKFHRSLKIPLGTRPEDLKARMEDGLLTLTYPEVPPHVEPHRIPIA